MDHTRAVKQMRRDGKDYLAIARELQIPLKEVLDCCRDVAPGPRKRDDHNEELELLRSTIADLKYQLKAAQEELMMEQVKAHPPEFNDLEWSCWMTAGAASAKLAIPGHTTIWRTCALGHDLDGRYFEARYSRPTDEQSMLHGTKYLVRYSLLPDDIKARHR